MGGRWSAPDGTATIYLASPEATCRAEMHRLLDNQSPTRVHFPRSLHTVSTDNLNIIDLSDADRLAAVDLDLDAVKADDRQRCQQVGEAIAHVGHQGLVAPSATGAGIVIAVFEPHIKPGQLIILDTTELPTDDDG
jgi:RES domain-containing protein